MNPITLVPNDLPCTFDKCPPGLFVYDGELCFKSEDSTPNSEGLQEDAYWLSGQYWWGKAKTIKDRNAEIVQPWAILYVPYQVSCHPVAKGSTPGGSKEK